MSKCGFSNELAELNFGSEFGINSGNQAHLGMIRSGEVVYSCGESIRSLAAIPKGIWSFGIYSGPVEKTATLIAWPVHL